MQQRESPACRAFSLSQKNSLVPKSAALTTTAYLLRVYLPASTRPSTRPLALSIVRLNLLSSWVAAEAQRLATSLFTKHIDERLQTEPDRGIGSDDRIERLRGRWK